MSAARTMSVLSCAALALAPVLLAGCTETSRQDVADANKKVQEEQRETDQARKDADKKIQEEQRETDAVRREANKPVIDEDAAEDIRDEERETQEAIKEGEEAVREEEEETDEAIKEAGETEAEFEAQQARDAFVKQAEAKLDAADMRLEALEEQGDKLEGVAKEENDQRMKELKDAHERLEDSLDDLKAADVLEWEQSRDHVDRDMNELSRLLDESK